MKIVGGITSPQEVQKEMEEEQEGFYGRVGGGGVGWKEEGGQSLPAEGWATQSRFVLGDCVQKSKPQFSVYTNFDGKDNHFKYRVP